MGSSVPLTINFTVLEPPGHGQLNLLDTGKRAVLRKNLPWFTSEDLTDQRVVYTHDDSESAADNVYFLARPIFKEVLPPATLAQLDFQYLGSLPIRIRMKNDNPPVRVADGVFRIVINGERKLTSDVLRFVYFLLIFLISYLLIFIFI